MAVFDAVDFDDHEEIAFFYDKDTNHKFIIAIHNTTRGPALGGCRMWPYETEQVALTDALRLSRGMTYKAAMANLPFGGGKIVVIGDSRKEKTPQLMRAVGRCVESFKGHYITAEDVGTSVEDMIYIREATSHVVGLPGGSGDPSPFTALGVYEGIRAAAAYRLGRNSLEGIRVSVQGLGHVGHRLCQLLAKAGAKLSITDINKDVVSHVSAECKAKIVSPEDIYGLEVDVFSPCALGAVINDETIPQFKCTIVAGSANNQLNTQRHGKILAERNILYAPDYVVNAGGLIDVSYEGPRYHADQVVRHVKGIYDTLKSVFQKAETLNISTSEAADLIAEERFSSRKTLGISQCTLK